MAIKIQGTVVLDYDGASYSSTNIAVGASALASITTGAYNVGVGYEALYTNTTGANNVGVGYRALTSNTIGTSNVGVGYSALRYNTTGTSNTGVGVNALYTNTTGIRNVGVGHSALYTNTIGNYNVGVGYAALYNNTTGANNVGVGYSALYTNTTGISNVGVGYYALRYNTTGNYNVGVGHIALQNNTTGVSNVGVGYGALTYNTIGGNNTGVGHTALYENTTGANNVGVGYRALYNNTIGTSNVGVGYSALYTNTTGEYNVGVGVNALFFNTTGVRNVGVGYGALNDNTTGTYNVGVGYNSLQNNTTGYSNTGVGYGALLTNTIGYYNVGVGYAALYYNTTGTSNVGVGYYALRYNTTGSYNVGIGYLALNNNTTGVNNVGVGYAALYDQTTAQYNTALGHNTGRGITTGSYNTIIGAQVTGLSATLTNTVIIADGAGNQRIYADSTGNVGIGTTSPLGFAGYGWITVNGASAGAILSLTTADSENFRLQSVNDQATYFNNLTAFPLLFQTNNAERMRIDPAGNVGIGTSVPGYKLTVAGVAAFGTASGVYGNYADMRLETATGYGWRMGTSSTGSTHGYFYIQGTTDNFVSSFINGLFIDTSGNVGIGTSSPGAKLDLTGGNLKLSGETSSEFTGMWLINTGSSASAYRGLYYDGRNENNIAVANMLVDVATDGSSAWSWSTTPAGSRTVDRRVERMRIDSSGLVGIGTSSAAAYGTLTVGQSGQPTGSEPSSRPNIEIWQGSPSINDAGGIDLRGSSSGSGYGFRISAIDSTGVHLVIGNRSSSTTYTERMRITSAGNVGIGTSAPTETLDVVGSVTISGSITKGSGSFKIDHPLKPDTHHLVHSFVEAPTADNIYRGRVDLVDGVATVDIDEAARLSGGTFVALNTNTDCWVNNKTGWTAVRATVSGSILSIEAQDNSCADTVSWLVIGERHDQTIIDATWTDEAGRVITEPQKDH